MSENEKIIKKELKALNGLINVLSDLESAFLDCLSVCEDTNSDLYTWSELPKEMEVDKATEDCLNMLKYIRDKRTGLEAKQIMVAKELDKIENES